jgi:hypothetical protein
MKEDFVNYGNKNQEVLNEILELIDKTESVKSLYLIDKYKFKKYKKRKCYNQKLIKKLKNIIGTKPMVLWLPKENYEKYVQALSNGDIRIKKSDKI